MKKLISLLLVLIMAAALCGCNKQLLDVTYHFDKAIIGLPNGEVIQGTVRSWTDFEDGDQIQVNIDGTTYLVHSTDIVLISE